MEPPDLKLWTAETAFKALREFPVEDGYVRVPTLYPGLNMTAMEPPDLKLWTAETAFKAQIVPQLYMFIPSALLGFIIGMTFWIINLVIIRLFSLARKSFNSNVGKENKSDDLKFNMQGLGQEDLWCHMSEAVGSIKRGDRLRGLRTE